MIQIIALSGSFAHPGKDGIPSVLSGDVADQLHNYNGLAHACPAKQARFSALDKRAKQINDFNSRFKKL